MMIPEVQQARDYNRGLPVPIRWMHVAAALVAWLCKPLAAWMNQPRRRAWARPLVFGLVAGAAVGIFDGASLRACRALTLWRPDLAPILRYAIVLASALGAAVIWLQNPRHRKRVILWAVAGAVTLILCRATSMLVGRPRPRFVDPGYFINPLGSYPIGPGLGIRHAWEFWAPGVWDIWSMPAVEAGWAAAGAAVIAGAYSRLRALAWLAAIIAAAAVVPSGLGYPSDAVIGAAIGAASGRWLIARHHPDGADRRG